MRSRSGRMHSTGRARRHSRRAREGDGTVGGDRAATPRARPPRMRACLGRSAATSCAAATGWTGGADELGRRHAHGTHHPWRSGRRAWGSARRIEAHCREANLASTSRLTACGCSGSIPRCLRRWPPWRDHDEIAAHAVSSSRSPRHTARNGAPLARSSRDNELGGTTLLMIIPTTISMTFA